jgi:hypothetical protein
MTKNMTRLKIVDWLYNLIYAAATVAATSRLEQAAVIKFIYGPDQ